MGEIKSTLDLVMERTRHLSLSAAEKEEQRREDFEKRLQGLLQQYADEAMSMDGLCERIAALEKETGIAGHELSVEAVMRRIEPDLNNDRWMVVLAHLAPDICHPLEEILETYGKEQAALLQTGRQLLVDRLAREDEITGSAVVPNPRKDPANRKKLADLQHLTRTKIEALVT
jgi:hypothetical protein